MIIKENAHLYIPHLQALSEGKKLQIFRDNSWREIYGPSITFCLLPGCYRIKPDPKWYRIAEFKYGNGSTSISVVHHEQTERQVMSNGSFNRWITDRVEYE